jgi:hypothetical protein
MVNLHLASLLPLLAGFAAAARMNSKHIAGATKLSSLSTACDCDPSGQGCCNGTVIRYVVPLSLAETVLRRWRRRLLFH